MVTNGMPLSDFAATNPGMHRELPLVHSTLCDNLQSIAAESALRPTDCPVFGMPLVYLFYGRPSYRSRKGATPDTRINYCPVCFIFKPSRLLAAPTRIFPFDSGAAKGGRFSRFISAAEADRYALSPAIKSIQQFTHKFFESNGDYFVGVPRSGLVIPADQHEAMRYYHLVSSDEPASFDDRRSAIEVQYSDPILLRDTLWAVVLPTTFLSDDNIHHAIVSEWGAFPITYNFVLGSLPSEYSSVIRAKYQDWLTTGGFFHE